MTGFIGMPGMTDIQRIDLAITEIRTILLILMDNSPGLHPDAGERFRKTWFPNAEESFL